MASLYQALYRKYRPQRFCDVVGQKHVTETLRRQVEAGRTAHAYLFIGSRGTGKTSCAKILSRALNCEAPQNGEPCNACAACKSILSGAALDVAEIDAASNNGVDNVRQLREEAVYSPAALQKRVYIIDEVHMLSNSAFNALLKIMEEPPAHLVFILATTELNKVPATILSRCQRYAFKRLTAEDIEGRVKEIVEKEQGSITPAAAQLIARLADGAMRDALSLLDQCMSGGQVTEEIVVSTVGLAGQKNTLRLFSALAAGDAAGAIQGFEELYTAGTDPTSVLNELLSLLRNMLIARVSPQGAEGLITGTLTAGELLSACEGTDTELLLRAAENLQKAIAGLTALRDKRTAAELSFIRLAGILTGAAEPQPAAPAPRPRPQSVPRPAPVSAPPPAEAPPFEELPPPPEEAPPAPEPMPAPQDEANWWEKIVNDPAVQNLPAAFFLGSPEVNAQMSGSSLLITSRNGFVVNMADTAEVKTTLAAAAERVLGKPVSVSVKREEASAALNMEKLNALSAKYDNFTIK